MLTGMGKRLRFKAAVALAVAYAFCALAPSAALAFADGKTTAHYLTDNHGIVAEHHGEAHVHAVAVGEPEATPNAAQPSEAQGKPHRGNCCGMFCVAALSVEPTVALTRTIAASVDLFTLVGDLGGRGPDQIHRPPIS